MLRGRDKNKDFNKKIFSTDIKSGAFFATTEGTCDVLIIDSVMGNDPFMINANTFVKIKSDENIKSRDGIVNWLNKRNYEKRSAQIVLD